MSKKFKIIVAQIIFLFLILLSCAFSENQVYDYSIDRIMNIIKEMSSKEFNGRMAGTKYGRLTEEYIEARFKEIGLDPGGNDGTYFQEFKGVYGNPSGENILEVLDEDKTIKYYKYAEDFKNLPVFSYSGEVLSEGVKLDSMQNIKKSGEAKIAFLRSDSNLNYNTLFFKNLYSQGYRGLIIARGGAVSRQKGQSGIMDKSEASKLPRVYVTNKVFDELVNFCEKGFKIHLKSSYEVKNFTARNVIGIIRSKKPSDKYLIISAHMDHLAPDPDGVYFPGALDNASGTACMIEIARWVKSQSKKPDINVVFIAFNGEEEMLYGSSYYVEHPIYPLKNTRVINLDMVGAKSDLPLTILKDGNGKRGEYEEDIFNEFEDKAKYFNLQYEISSGGGSDHIPFARAGVPAVTLIDYERSTYHVPEDDINNIGEDNLKRAMDLVLTAVKDEIYTSEAYHVSYIWIYIVIAGAFSTIIYIFVFRKKLNER